MRLLSKMRFAFLALLVISSPSAGAFQTIIQLCDQIWENEEALAIEIQQICSLNINTAPVIDCFYEAVQQGRSSLVEFLLTDERVAEKPTPRDMADARALALYEGHDDIVELLDEAFRQYLASEKAPQKVALVATILFLLNLGSPNRVVL